MSYTPRATPKMSSAGKWLRVLGPQEEGFEDICNNGTLTISYLLRIKTSRKLTEDEARRVFTVIPKTCPNLRLIVAEKDDKLWLKEMDKPTVNFEVTQDANVHKEFEDMARVVFPASGPLWRVRFLPWSPSQKTYIDSLKLEGSESTDKKYPHICHFVIGYKHVITDGHSCHKILRQVLTLIDDLISGKDIEKAPEIGDVIDGKDEMRFTKEAEQRFIKNPSVLETKVEGLKLAFQENLIEKAFPMKSRVFPETLVVPHIVDRETSTNFRQRCKREGVTFNSGFMAVLDAATVKLLQERKLEKEFYTSSAVHVVNQRQYYTNCENSLGIGTGCIVAVMKTPKNVLENFWDYAKIIHSDIRSKIEQKESVEMHVIQKLSGIHIFELTDKDGIDMPPPKMVTYVSSNMLDVTSKFDKIGDHVELDYYDRVTSCQIMPNIWQSTFQSYRGQLMHSLSYNAHLMTAQTAKRLSDAIFAVMAEVADK